MFFYGVVVINSQWLDRIAYAAVAAVFSVLIFFGSASFSQRNNAVPASATTVYHDAAGPDTSARAFVLADACSGDVLLCKNADERLPMASTTKIMTAVVIIENLPHDMMITVPEEAVGVEGSSIYLAHGESLTVTELLYGLLLESGNDAAAALAIACGGSVEKFADMMNEKAAQLGLCNTHFDNPHGLTSDNHYTTAHDLAVITAYAIKNPTFSKIAGTEKYVIAEREGCRARYFFNHNRLLGRLDICDGVKTGYTAAAGRCLVTSATVGDSRFVAVTLNDRRDWEDHRSLLTYAAENYKSVCIAKAGEISFTLETDTFPKHSAVVSNEKDVFITLPCDYNGVVDISISADADDRLYGDVAGSINVRAGQYEKSIALTVTQHTDDTVL